uniref:Uncharacterized protein n=1 Tax=Anguilla anguilla TaxID=7936 RepID=A0A0E9VUK8_ANGAN
MFLNNKHNNNKQNTMC